MRVSGLSLSLPRSAVWLLGVLVVVACEQGASGDLASAPAASVRALISDSAGSAAPSVRERAPMNMGMSPAAPQPLHILVTYDTSGDYGWLGELNAAAFGTLASHFGTWDAVPVGNYQAGDLAKYGALIYIGSSDDQPLSQAFLGDVAASTVPVIWIDQNIQQLASSVPEFATLYGFAPADYDTSAIASVAYKGVTLTRDTTNDSGIMTYSAVGEPSVTLAQAVRADGTQFPWAVRGRNLFYVGENPLSYITMSDRYLAFCDLLYEALAPNTPERHRALVRIEDVSAQSDPTILRELADYLASQNVPFSVATIPQYEDPLGVYNSGQPLSEALHEAPDLVDALNYMKSKGGTLIMHGYTHQYANLANPYSGVSADDFEFYRVHFDSPQTQVAIYDGPVMEDSADWASQRFSAGLTEFATAGLGKPDVFEWPHYWGSDVDSRALKAFFPRVYHQVLYFSGVLSGSPADYTRQIGMFLPYGVHDVYGFEVIPENLDHYTPDSAPDEPSRSADDIVADAKRNLVVRDGFASFFFHGYFSAAELAPIVTGIQAAGYQFVSIDQLDGP